MSTPRPTLAHYRHVLALLAAALLIPALFNGFPLVHPDSGTYLRVAARIGWPVDRSGFYGLLMLPAVQALGGPAALWLWIALQAVLTAVILVLVLKSLIPDFSTRQLLALGALMIIGTALPWQAAQLMPDAFTGLVVLTAWLAMSRSPTAPGVPLLWLTVCILAVTHVTHLVILLALGSVMVAVALLERLPRGEVIARAGALLVACLFIAGAQIAINGSKLGIPAVSPSGPIFLFARLNEDGHMQPWLDRHCGKDAPANLCAIRDQLPHDSQKLLWGPDSGTWFPAPAPGEQQRFVDLMNAFGAADRGAIAERPGAVLKTSVRGAASQLLTFGPLDDECPEMCADPDSVLRLSFDQAGHGYAATLTASRQLRGTMPDLLVRSLTFPMTVCGLLALLPLLVAASTRRDFEATSLLAVVVVTLAVNAFMAGALSDVHARYQSRIVWLAPLAVIGVFCRWKVAGRRRSSAVIIRPKEEAAAI
ncbi:hypothetical protein OMW55_13275 [Sphingomonas sp. BN140010]|uniref:Uncharacterized protein n=1 Tax=Sphingomonas arvum TaxID=2992113 RepID=A0ABT3JI97_9SPHN|nr:hypothetical protein [Sphingomonas sp. BN140010]MCW3798780.1 hypothetical protein [Sphingomonas sp. BN140010]